MSGSQGWPTPITAGDFFQQMSKRIGTEERRPRITKASDLLGPITGPRAIEITDLDGDQAAFNGWVYVSEDTLSSPDNTKEWVGQVIASDEGGVQILWSFAQGDGPYTTYRRTWYNLPDTGTRVYTLWEQENVPRKSSRVMLTPVTGSVFDLYSLGVQRQDSMVVLTGGLRRPSGSSGSTYVNVAEIPDGFKPNAEVLMLNSAFYNVAETYQFYITSGGMLQQRQTAARAFQMSANAIWFTDDDWPV